MVGFKVGCIWYEIGAASFLHSFFSTVAYNLECGNWGTRFPVIMNELYQGKLANANNGFSPDLQNRQLAPVYQLSHCVPADAAGFSRFFDRHSHFDCVHHAVLLS